MLISTGVETKLIFNFEFYHLIIITLITLSVLQFIDKDDFIDAKSLYFKIYREKRFWYSSWASLGAAAAYK